MSRHFPLDMTLEARAERRVRRKLGWMIHAFVFVVVNAGLFAINTLTGAPHWAQFPLYGWGLGLAIHGIVTVFALQGEGLRRNMLARELEQLRRGQA